MRAWNLTRPEIHYRHDAFSAGLRAVGFDVQKGQPTDVKPGDLVLSWNRYQPNHDICTRVEAAGGIALICENGYLGPNGVSPHSMNPRQWFALARHAHNDSSVVPMGEPERFDALGVRLAPWRATGDHILLCPGRPFGMPGRIQPADWAQNVRQRLEKITKRPIRVRPHPGNSKPAKPLADDLAGAHCVVIWSSSAGVHALVAGISVICEAPNWICKTAAGNELIHVEHPWMDDDARLAALQRMAWGQFSIDEIATGEPFRRLLA